MPCTRRSPASRTATEYRIRIYNLSDARRMECKSKLGNCDLQAPGGDHPGPVRADDDRPYGLENTSGLLRRCSGRCAPTCCARWYRGLCPEAYVQQRTCASPLTQAAAHRSFSHDLFNKHCSIISPSGSGPGHPEVKFNRVLPEHLPSVLSLAAGWVQPQRHLQICCAAALKELF